MCRLGTNSFIYIRTPWSKCCTGLIEEGERRVEYLRLKFSRDVEPGKGSQFFTLWVSQVICLCKLKICTGQLFLELLETAAGFCTALIPGGNCNTQNHPCWKGAGLSLETFYEISNLIWANLSTLCKIRDLPGSRPHKSTAHITNRGNY